MMGYWGWGFPDKPIRKNGKMSDDLTTAYLLGVEHMRDKLHKQADEIERLRDENEKLRFERDTIGEANYVNGWNDAINSSEAMQDLRKENEQLRKDLKTAIMGDSAELADVKRENERLRELLKDCSNELADEINARYGGAKDIHRHRYDRDMQTVRAVAAALGETDG